MPLRAGPAARSTLLGGVALALYAVLLRLDVGGSFANNLGYVLGPRSPRAPAAALESKARDWQGFPTAARTPVALSSEAGPVLAADAAPPH